MDLARLRQLVLSRYDAATDAAGAWRPLTPLTGGLINDTFALGDAHVLQRLHPIFAATVNEDIAALTPTLAAAGVPVPRLVPTRDGALWVEVEAPRDQLGGTWRLMTRLPGRTLHRLEQPAQARGIAAMVGRFHRALADVDHAFRFTRPGAHDTDAHMARLVAALDAHPHHRLRDAVGPLTDALRARWDAWGQPPTLPARVIHGDLKVSNVLLGPDDAVTGLIDLDTMARATLDVELGDALRSWCATGDESAAEARCDLAVFEAAIDGYLTATRGWLTEAERAAIPPAVERICLELAARFATDALEERYFGWDPSRAPTRGAHCLLRARNQLALARSAAHLRPAMARLLV